MTLLGSNLQMKKDLQMNFYDDVKPSEIRHFIPDNEKDLRRLEMISENQLSFPNPSKKCIILHGRYGTGKTELVKIFPKVLEKNRLAKSKNETAENFFGGDLSMFLSCQANNSKEVVEKAMITSASLNKSGLHYVILDEVDNIRLDWQRSLKSFITKYDHIIFLMTTNHITKIDGGLKSRSHLISFENPSKALWLNRCVEICNMYKVEIDERFLKNMIAVARYDAREILSRLEEYVVLQRENVA